MWLYFALLTPFFFGLVHVLDSYCVEDIFEKPWMGMVTGAFASIIVFAPLPYILPFVSWELPSWHIIVMALAAGVLIQLSQGLYFQALSLSEAGIVAAYWNMVPAMVPVASFIVFKEVLSLVNYMGIAILVASSVGFCLLDGNFRWRRRAFLLMGIASAMQAVMFLLQEVVFDTVPYFLGFLLITCGIVLGGFAPLLSRSTRTLFARNIHRLYPLAKLFIAIELINLLALASSQRAVDLGIPSMVAGVESTIPAYTFILSIAFFIFTRKIGDPSAMKRFPQKIVLIGTMVLGVIAVA